MKHCLKWLVGSIMLLALPVSADTGLWLSTGYRYDLNDNWHITGDNQWRSWDLAKEDFNTLLLRNRFVYKDTVGAGYAFLNRGDFGESDRTVQEHRLFQDIYTDFGRFRLEQRWVEGSFSTRYRWKYLVDRPNWYAYNEYFMTPDGFNQNRTKLMWKATEKLSVGGQYIYSDFSTAQIVFNWNF